ncbi:hypothetical protein F9C07_2197654 [Aspergillus flavus]|uniref:Hemerythrin-like domain-containing protein n=1 Tax=Aspergillus flavus (strain ATCC 200026 / FGSC A1120 / IAM 13836 / NRRL 3357 / JCM 12722 / SRRC 167) TaxID=332952 RepID=A0A7U2QRA0_ASPFN|nr:hemerythrin HHE cation binding domain-containing protein [Aspergillus flavus]QRD81387.1 hypothetical protein F9C07_2197654 [Aspergillus flavus]
MVYRPLGFTRPLKQLDASQITRRLISNSRIAMAARIVDTIKTDHREIVDYYSKVLNSTSNKEKVQWQNQFTWELARHSIAEELVVYPQLEKKLADGRAMAEKDRNEHQTVKEQLKEFQNMKPSDPDLDAKDLYQHIKEEGSQDLSKLEDAITEEESKHLTKSFGRTKMFVPSRSHPSAPDKPPFETGVGLMTAPIHQLADLFRKGPHTSGMPNPSTK